MIDEKGKELSGTNGEAVEKTPEQLKQEKIDAFNANPDMFVHRSEIIIGCVKSGDGLYTAMGNYPRNIVESCLTKVTFMVFNAFIQLETIKEMQAAQGNIIHASGVPVSDVKKRGLFRR